MAKDLDVQKHVAFFNRFVGIDELLRFIGAADIYITPYLTETQITSGTLAYAFGCGNAVISTPYWHAAELLADGLGVLVPFRDAKAIGNAVISLLKDETLRNSIRKTAYAAGRGMIWSRAAELYMHSFHQAGQDHSFINRRLSPVKTLDEKPGQLPILKLDHLYRMSDSTGIFQHASFTVPNFSEGYCTDDNARALLLTLMLKQSGLAVPRLHELSGTYVAFINYAFDRNSLRFRNFMSFDRQWLEDIGSEDCHGQALWALGLCISPGVQDDFHKIAVELFEQALSASVDFTSPRSWAFTLLGIEEYLKRLGGDRRAYQIREILSAKLMQRYADAASADWEWFEDIVTYANAKLPHALIISGHSMNDSVMLETGLKTLRWLVSIQLSENGSFRPIGSNGFYPKNRARQQFDQQPIEAQATISACIAAYTITADEWWAAEALRAFEWFLGRNDLGLPLYDPVTGGCHDGLHIDRISQNQGAESTLAYLLSLSEMQTLQSSRSSFKKKGSKNNE